MLLKFFFYLMCWFTVFYVLRFSLVFQDLCDLIVPYIYEHFGLCLLFIKISTKKNYIVSHECKQSPNPSDVESFIRLSNFKYFASEYVGKKMSHNCTYPIHRIFRRYLIFISRRSISDKNIVHFFVRFLNLSFKFNWSFSLLGLKYVTILQFIISIAACVFSSPRRKVAYAKSLASSSAFVPA